MNKFPIVTEFASAEVPLFLEKKNKNIVYFGVNNMYPFELIDLYNDSSTHNAIINGKVGYTVGNGLYSEDLQVKKWLSQANIDEDWTSLTKRLSLDYELFNGYAIEVIKTGAGNQYHHIDFANIRVGLDGGLQYADDWITEKGTPNSKPDIQYLERYNPRDLEQKRGIIYHVDYRPNMKYYPLPVYVGSLAEIKTDVQIGDYWLNEVQNGFVGGTLIQHNNGVPETKEESEEFEKAFQEKFGKATGTKIVHLFSPSKDNGSEITNLNGNDLHERYLEMSNRVKESIFIGHRITNPILFGVKEEGALGARNELDLAYEIFTNTYIAERQNTLLRTIRKLAFFEIQRTDIDIIPLKPIDTVDLTSDIILGNLSREEIRELINEQTGLELKEEVSTQVDMKEDCNCDEFKAPCWEGYEMIGMKVKNGELVPNCVPQNMSQDLASIVQDGKPLFDTIEEAEIIAGKLGCEGYHEHEIDGKVWYMPCSTHSEISDKGLEGFSVIDKFDTYNDYPKSASNNAKRAIKYADKNGWGKCGTNVGKQRAHQLAKGEKISRETIARMASFKRHQQHKDVPYSEGCGGIMWDAWGGTSGVEWAINKLKEIDSKKMSACSCFSKEDEGDVSDLFDAIGVSESDYEEIERFDVHFDENGSPFEFATKEQGIIQRVLKSILVNPLIAASGLGEALGLDFEQLINSINILKSSNLLEVEGSSINLTPVGERVAKAIEIPETEIKYKYTLRSDAPALKGGKSRDFCRKMMSKKKLYSRKEIDLLRNDMKSGRTADVWLARGGWYRRPNTDTNIPFCRHIWKQVLVKKK